MRRRNPRFPSPPPRMRMPTSSSPSWPLTGSKRRTSAWTRARAALHAGTTSIPAMPTSSPLPMPPVTGPTSVLQVMPRLLSGLALCGVAVAMLVRSDLGLGPWDVLHQGLAVVTGISIGVASILVGFLVLVLWFPLRERPGVGTITNIVTIGLVIDATLAVTTAPSATWVRWGTARAQHPAVLRRRRALHRGRGRFRSARRPHDWSEPTRGPDRGRPHGHRAHCAVAGLGPGWNGRSGDRSTSRWPRDRDDAVRTPAPAGPVVPARSAPPRSRRHATLSAGIAPSATVRRPAPPP